MTKVASQPTCAVATAVAATPTAVRERRIIARSEWPDARHPVAEIERAAVCLEGMRGAWVWIVATVCTAASARAEEPAWDLAWRAPPPCPDEAQVRAAVERLLVGTAEARRPVRVEAEVVAPGHATTTWRVVLRGADGARELTAPSCDELAEATAVIVALMVEPLADEPAPAPVPVPAPVPAPARIAPRPTPPPDAPDVAEAPPASPLEVVLAVRPQASLGILPAVAAGGAASVGLTIEDFRVEMGFGFLLPRSAAFSEHPSTGGDVSWLGGELGARYAFRVGDVELAPQLGWQIGRLSARGFGTATTHEQQALWLAPLLDATATWRPSDRWGLALGLGAGVPVLRPSFVVVPYGEVFRPSAVTGRLWLGGELRL
jgi:hypothetical protein